MQPILHSYSISNDKEGYELSELSNERLNVKTTESSAYRYGYCLLVQEVCRQDPDP